MNESKEPYLHYFSRSKHWWMEIVVFLVPATIGLCIVLPILRLASGPSIDAQIGAYATMQSEAREFRDGMDRNARLEAIGGRYTASNGRFVYTFRANDVYFVCEMDEQARSHGCRLVERP